MPDDPRFPHLSKAPIVEAAFHLCSQFGALWELDQIRERLERELPEYTAIEPLHSQQTNIDFTQNQITQSPVIVTGWKMSRGNRQAMFQRDSMLYSHLAPYETWDDFAAEALRVWRIYQKIGNHQVATRLGIRFINRIEFPKEGFQFIRYLKNVRFAPEGTKWGAWQFMHQTSLVDPNTGLKITLISALIPLPQEQASFVPIVLDIDVVKDAEVDLIPSGELLAKMRELKNQAFFLSLTDETISLLK
jgi:uncharacterized protein (TIGR04255 family)